MIISNFKINPERTAFNVTILDAADISTLRFWTDSTYKDYDQAIDLSSKLSAQATETFTITLDDVNLSYFDGIYFLEAEDPDEVSGAVEGDLTRFEECILNKLREYSVCEDCLQEESVPLTNALGLVWGLEKAIEQGFVDEIFSILVSLNKFCSNECKSCGEYRNIINNNYYSTNND